MQRLHLRSEKELKRLLHPVVSGVVRLGVSVGSCSQCGEHYDLFARRVGQKLGEWHIERKCRWHTDLICILSDWRRGGVVRRARASLRGDPR